jgi:hypothetical protein
VDIASDHLRRQHIYMPRSSAVSPAPSSAPVSPAPASCPPASSPAPAALKSPLPASSSTTVPHHGPLHIAFRHATHPAPEAARASAIPDRVVAAPDKDADLAPQLAPAIHRIAIKCGGKILFLNPAEIHAAHAQGNYVLLQQSRGSHLLREQISVVAEKLARYGFIRIHRSVLVNVAYVETIEPLFTGEYLLRMRGGREYNVTRTFKKNLQLLAESWIGTGIGPGFGNDSFVA